MSLPASLVLVGAGKMGGAMLEGWLKLGLDPAGVTIIDPGAGPAMTALCAEKGMRLNPPAGSIAAPEVMLLAIKPQMLESAAPGLASIPGPNTVLISVVAGKTIDDLTARIPVKAVIRAMPNTPAAVGRGITGAVANEAVTQAQRAQADALLRAIGRLEWLDKESWVDMVTAVSGSGPAYVFYLTECLAKAGAELGLPPDLAARLARAMVEGAGELMFQDAATEPATLRQNVTSPAGTTAAALDVLMAKDGLKPLMSRAVAAAHRRAEELSG